MQRDDFRDKLLGIMERKKHWAWPAFTEGWVPKSRLCVHFEQEYATYVRDFPVLVGWAYVQCPIPWVRCGLAENLYEEETGGLVAKRPHPELFLEYPRGLGMDLRRFEQITLLPAAQIFRAFLDQACQRQGWEAAAAVTTLFLEGTCYERGEVDPTASRRPVVPLEEHPLVRHYGLPLECLALTRAHREVEGGHRKAAWSAVLDHVAAGTRQAVVRTMEEALGCWWAYRDEVAAACGVRRGSDGGVQTEA